MATKKGKGPTKAAKKATAKKPAAKKAKPAAKKATAKKPVAKRAKPAAKKAAAKKPAAKKAKPMAKKAKPAAKKAKPAAKKAKPVAKKAKPAAKKAAAKKPVAEKAKPAAKKAAAKKSVAKKAKPVAKKATAKDAAAKAPAPRRGERKRKEAPKAEAKEYRPTARMGPDGVLILSTDKALLRAYYGGHQMPSPMQDGFLMLLGVQPAADGGGTALFECSASSLRCQLSIPKANTKERRMVKDVQEAGDDPNCPRHEDERLVRAGKSLTCRKCGISYGKV